MSKVRIIDNALVSPLKSKGRHRSNIIYDSIYPVFEGNLFRGENLDFFIYDGLPNKGSSSKVLKGRSIYLGLIDSHYGHSITESISRLYALDGKFDYILFAYGNKRNLNNALKNSFNTFFIDKMRKHGKVLFVDESFICEKLYVPEQSFILGRYCLKSYIKSARFLINDFKYLNINSPNKIYLSRSRLIDNPRVLADEAEIEGNLSKEGFEVIYPEELSFSEQITLFKNANTIVGFEGTALLNVVWTKSKDIHVISIGNRNQRNIVQEHLCDVMSAKFTLIDLAKVNKNKISEEVLNACIF